MLTLDPPVPRSHNPFHHCPVHADKSPKLECSCDPKEQTNFEFHGYSCTKLVEECLGTLGAGGKRGADCLSRLVARSEFKALTRWKHPETVSHRKEVFGMLH